MVPLDDRAVFNRVTFFSIQTHFYKAVSKYLIVKRGFVFLFQLSQILQTLFNFHNFLNLKEILKQKKFPKDLDTFKANGRDALVF